MIQLFFVCLFLGLLVVLELFWGSVLVWFVFFGFSWRPNFFCVFPFGRLPPWNNGINSLFKDLNLTSAIQTGLTSHRRELTICLILSQLRQIQVPSGHGNVGLINRTKPVTKLFRKQHNLKTIWPIYGSFHILRRQGKMQSGVPPVLSVWFPKARTTSRRALQAAANLGRSPGLSAVRRFSSIFWVVYVWNMKKKDWNSCQVQNPDYFFEKDFGSGKEIWGCLQSV